MRIKGKKYGIITSRTVKYHDRCKYCRERYPSCVCWKQENDMFMHQDQPEEPTFKRDGALQKRALYKHRKEEERKAGWEEVEDKRKPEFDRRIHRPHIDVDNWRSFREERKKVKTVFRKELKSEVF